MTWGCSHCCIDGPAPHSFTFCLSPLFTPSPRRCFVHKMGTEQEQRLPGFAALSQRGFQGFCRSRLGPGHLLPPPNPAIRHPARCLPQAPRCCGFGVWGFWGHRAPCAGGDAHRGYLQEMPLLPPRLFEQMAREEMFLPFIIQQRLCSALSRALLYWSCIKDVGFSVVQLTHV